MYKFYSVFLIRNIKKNKIYFLFPFLKKINLAFRDYLFLIFMISRIIHKTVKIVIYKSFVCFAAHDLSGLLNKKICILTVF